MRTVDQRQGLKRTSVGSLTNRFRAGSFRLVLFALMWWILTDGASNSWLVGVPIIVFATVVSVVLLPSFSWSLMGVLRFVPFFLWQSLLGGLDVARRVFHPKLPIAPGLYEHRWRLPPGLARVFMANTVSLLPGTLSAELDKERLRVHVLDQTGAFASELAMIEMRVAQMFGLKLSAGGSEE